MNIDLFTKYATIVSGFTSFIDLISLTFVWRQLSENKKITQQQFEDNLAKEYR